MAQQVFGRRWSVWMADTVCKKFPELRNRWAYDYGVVCKGMEKIYEMTKDAKYFEYIKNNMDHFLLNDGSIRYYDQSAYNLDYINNGKSLLFLYQQTGDEKYKNGVWYQVLDKEDCYGNFKEASCSCMFTYFLLKAIRKEYISKEYYEHAKKAFYGIIREFIEVDEKAFLNLKDTVYVSGLGGDQLRDGSFEYYTSEPKQINNLLGIGAFLMASAEMEQHLRKV